MPRAIYVETTVACDLDELWKRTQEPGLHARWDLRFTTISYLPKASEDGPQRFGYTTKIGFGLEIAGDGESVGDRSDPAGGRTSTLKFRSDDPKSLIAEGSGFWRYVPAAEGVRFFTRYDYRARHGAAGRLLDRVLFRPLLGWATAWSFDRLRLWIERGIDPDSAFRLFAVHALARCAVALVFLWHGLVPKILAKDPLELELFSELARVPAFAAAGGAPAALLALGLAEAGFGIALLVLFRVRWLYLVSGALMLAATGAVALRSPELFTAAFNPLTLNLSVLALSLAGFVAAASAPSAARCLRSPAEGA